MTELGTWVPPGPSKNTAGSPPTEDRCSAGNCARTASTSIFFTSISCFLSCSCGDTSFAQLQLPVSFESRLSNHLGTVDTQLTTAARSACPEKGFGRWPPSSRRRGGFDGARGGGRERVQRVR